MFSDSWCDWSVQPCTKHLVGVAKFCFLSGCDREESVEIRYAEGLRGRHMESLAGVAQGTRTDPKVSTGLLKSGSRHLGGYKVATLRRGKLAAPSGTRCPPRVSER